jgi:hypothetical protein
MSMRVRATSTKLIDALKDAPARKE